jgi:hypothetical protein
MDNDRAQIVATAHELRLERVVRYGDVSGMERALHRGSRSSGHLLTDQASAPSFVTAEQMITWTCEGEGQAESPVVSLDRTIEVEVLDVKHDIVIIAGAFRRPYYGVPPTSVRHYVTVGKVAIALLVASPERYRSGERTGGDRGEWPVGLGLACEGQGQDRVWAHIRGGGPNQEFTEVWLYVGPRAAPLVVTERVLSGSP